MASKLLFFPLLLALTLKFSNISAAPQVIDITNEAAGEISITIKDGGNLKGSARISPRQNYKINVDNVNDVYSANATFTFRLALFPAYAPGRDKGQAVVYWKADNWGFSISYDNKNFKPVTPWRF
ncbi:hypothetical protein CDL12_01921 [Handroanthus impetiginosus]|uniref:Uncharacterized protein n=1 Tax=Handroanthus impetiginosus TaxID=429701 RepID=A0A2G9I6H4_9LAMI|nr:hypothetical protein CDL12_01921 [Handroanthus impetiginosus]